jgi:predicted ATPase
MFATRHALFRGSVARFGTISPNQAYDKLVASGAIKDDPMQRHALVTLDRIWALHESGFLSGVSTRPKGSSWLSFLRRVDIASSSTVSPSLNTERSVGG